MTRKKPLSEAAKERAAIVRWLRRESKRRRLPENLERCWSDDLLEQTATRIANQEHRK